MNLLVIAGLVITAIIFIGAWSLGPLGRAITGNDPFTMFEVGVGTIQKTGQSIGNEISNSPSSTNVGLNEIQQQSQTITSNHFITSSFTIQPNSKTIIKFTTAIGEKASLTGSATLKGSIPVQMMVQKLDGSCPGICSQQMIFSNTKDIQMSVMTGSQQQLVLYTINANQPATIDLNLDLTYKETSIHPQIEQDSKTTPPTETFTIPNLG